jgi:helix-turn-helix protein
VHLMNEYEAADVLALSVRTLQKFRVTGRGPAFHKLGRAVRYDMAEIERFVRDGTRSSTSDPGQGAAA